MTEETVMTHLFFAFKPEGIVAEAQFARHLVRDDGTVLPLGAVPHQRFSLAKATTKEKALLKKALGAVQAAQLIELHAAGAALALRDQEFDDLTKERDELRARLALSEEEIHGLVLEGNALRAAEGEARGRLAQVQDELALHLTAQSVTPEWPSAVGDLHEPSASDDTII